MSIEKKLSKCGWINAQVQSDCCSGLWPEPHFRVTVWHRTRKPDGNPKSPGRLWAMGDGATLAEAWERCFENVARERFGYSAE